MRFERIRLEAFGGLRNLDTGERPLGRFVVVEGPNEAGKSTFFEFLVALLYGFYPASRERNPFAPWSDEVASGHASLRLDGGGCLDVQRRLLTSPTGLVSRGDEEVTLRNETLEVAAHVPRRVYRQVFALTLSELTALESDGWDAVQDRLLGALGARDLRPARRVADELEEQAGTLWRTSRRGNQTIRTLDVKLGDLAYRRSELREQEQGLREAHGVLAVRRERLEALQGERDVIRERLEHARRLAPIQKELVRVAEFRARAGPPNELEGLPSDPLDRLNVLRAALAEASDEAARLEQERARLRDEAGALGETQRAVLALADDIAAIQGDVRAADTDLVRLGRLEQESRDLARRIDTLLAPFGAQIPVDRQALRALPLHEVRPAVAALQRARFTVNELDAREKRARERSARLPGQAVWLALGVAALATMVAAWSIQAAGLAIGAGVALAVAVAGWGVRRALASADVPAPADRARGQEALQRAEEALRQTLGVLLDDVTRSEQLEALPSALERARDLLGDQDDREAAASETRERIEALAGRARALARQAGLNAADGDATPGSTAARLDQALAEARRHASNAAVAGRELERVGERHGQAVPEKERVSAELRALEARLAAFGNGDPEVGAREAAARLQAARRAREIGDDLAATYTKQELAEARSVHAHAGNAPEGSASADEADAVGALVRRERGLTDEIETLSREVLELEGRISRLTQRETLDALDGEVAALAEDRTRLVRERDRLWVLARVVREAELWVREEHQPELLRRASGLLATLTGGRYERIVLDPSGRGFRVRGPATPRSLPVDTPLSTGTREQIYLALRLALFDTLDGSGERLPVALDEVLVNWDPVRRDRGLDALAHLSERRQVFLMTCHREIAEGAAARGAMRIALPGFRAP